MIDLHEIGDLIRKTAIAVVLPRFRNLQANQIREKHPGDYVTIADTEAEEMLGRLLMATVPGTVVCGEEAVARDRTTLDLLGQSAPVWVIDPVDGTGNFANGRIGFAMIVALIENGVTTAGWIHDPLNDITIHAQRGGGAWCGRQRMIVDHSVRLAGMNGSAYGCVPDGANAYMRLTAAGAVAEVENTGSGGIDYILMARSVTHFKFSSVSLPWDHAAGILIMQEAGAVARFFDGSPYDIRRHKHHLLITPTEETWTALHGILARP